MRPSWPDGRQEPSAPAVDPVIGKCRPGKVHTTVSTSPLTLDMTVVCTPDPELLHPEAVAQEVLPDTRPVGIFGIAAVVWTIDLVFLVAFVFTQPGA